MRGSLISRALRCLAMNRKLVSIIIVNWNGKKYLEKCLSSLRAQNYKKVETILVDNGSADDSVSWVREKFPEVKIIENDKNLGFAQANNIGYESSKGAYVLFLNNDTEVKKDFLIELVKVLEENKEIGGAQGKIFLMGQPNRLDSVGAFLTPTGFLYHFGVRKKDSPKYSKRIYIHTAKGACMMFKRKVLEKVKVEGEIFDQRYFAYFEESDLCHRVWLAGYKIVFVPNSVIYHEMGATSSKLRSSFIQYHSYKNRINSYIKNLGMRRLAQILPTHIILCELLSIYYLLKRDVGTNLSIQKAIFWNFVNIKNTLMKRRYVQRKIRKVNDQEIFPLIFKNVGLSYYYHLFSGLSGYKDQDLNFS